MTTLDTKVTEVDQLEVGANNTTVGVAITQSGSGDILNLYDGSSEVFSVATQGDGIGAITISSPKPRIVFTETNTTPDYQIRMNGGISIHDSTNNIGRISITSSRTDINNPVYNNDTVWIGDKLVHWTDDDTAIRFLLLIQLQLKLEVMKDFASLVMVRTQLNQVLMIRV